MSSEHSPCNSAEQVPTEYKPPDFSKFALSQNFGAQIKIIKRLTTVSVRKPSKTQWFQIHPEYKLDVLLSKYGDSGDDYYIVEPSLAHQLEDLAQAFRLFVGADRQGVVFVWPLRLPDEERPLNWHLSALEAASNAEVQWTRIHAHMSLGAYEIHAAEGIMDEPKWPEMSKDEILDIAFKNKIIDRLDHFVLKQLRGKA
ncbi:MAG: hypothetical protein CL921_01625 [Deltaproteobacteria bacterium]|nr:hypothetical protein [Deltaproteobacteria bacterium]